MRPLDLQTVRSSTQLRTLQRVTIPSNLFQPYLEVEIMPRNKHVREKAQTQANSTSRNADHPCAAAKAVARIGDVRIKSSAAACSGARGNYKEHNKQKKIADTAPAADAQVGTYKASRGRYIYRIYLHNARTSEMLALLL